MGSVATSLRARARKRSDAPATEPRARLPHATLALLVAIAIGVLLMLPAPQERSQVPAAGEAITLRDDDGGTPMFDIEAMAPGESASKCIAVTLGGSASAAGLFAVTGGGSLGEHLRLTVDEGTGGGFDSCSGFSGTRIYDGTLAAFATAHGTDKDALATSLAGDSGRTRTFRFRLRMAQDNAAQGAAVTARFGWTAHGSGPAAPDAPDAPRDAEPGGPGPDAPAPAAPAPSAPAPAAPGEGAPAAPPSGSSTGGTGTRGGARERARQRRPRDGSRARGGEPAGRQPQAGSSSRGKDRSPGALFRKLGQRAQQGAARGAFPLFLLFLVLIFFAIQDRIDRRDPKIALAPLNDEPYIEFRPDTEGGGA